MVAPTDRSAPVLQAVYTGDAADPAPLLEALQERLPASMVPGTLLRLPALPLNLNGRTDRGAVVAALDTARRAAPRTPLRTPADRTAADVPRTLSPSPEGTR
ncbi:hypothetical protein [Streptomyces sp. NPDC058735]|uniref:hypothetical protein n=1 Tax=unclassified Streptomyces TaxID=2593676 RepID=UPI0036959C4E